MITMTDSGVPAHLGTALLEVGVSTQITVMGGYREINPDTPSYIYRKFYFNTNDLAGVVLIPHPATGISYLIDWISVQNIDSVTHTIVIALGLYTVIRTTLLPGERLEYADGTGWQVIDKNGSLKVVQTDPRRNIAYLTGDVTNNNAVANTIANVTGLGFPVEANKRYRFRFAIDYTAQAGTTGSRWSINGPAATRLTYDSEYALTTIARTQNFSNNAYDVPAAANATTPTTAGNMAYIEGFITPSAAGTVVARFASEVAGSAIVAKAGSFVEWEEV